MGYLKAPKINTSARMTSAWAASELLYDTDLNAFFKGDGTTTGGVRLAEGDLASVLSIISALEARVSALSATPAGVSVTSNELSVQIASAVSNLRSVINVVSNTASVNNAARISVDNVLSNAISVVSNALSVETQARITADNALSNTISALNSAYLSLVNRVSANSGIGGGGSVTSAQVQAVSTQAASAINVVSNALSTLSNQNSADHVSIRNLISVVSVEAANALSIANAASNAASILNVALANELSVRAAADSNILSLISVLEARVSANSGAGGSASVTSTELSNALSVVSAQAASAINVVSNALSVETASRVSAINVLSNTISNLTSALNALSAAAGNSVTSAEVAQVLSNALSAVNALNLSNVVSVGNSTSLEIQVSGVRTPHVQFDPSVSAPNTSIYSLTKDVDYNLINYQALSTLGFIIPQDDVWAVKNQTASLIPKGSAVMAVGTTGASGRVTVDLMVADGSVSPVYLLGVTVADIPSGADGFLLNKGKIKKLNTNAWTAGTILYCDPAVPGGLTSTIPQAPNLKLAVAFVIYQDATNGIIAVRVSEGARLSEDHDIQFTSVTNGDLIRYNLSALRWENFAPDYATSNQLSAVSAQAASAVNVVSNAVSIVSVAAANALSVANAASNAVSVEIVNRISADNVLSLSIHAVSNALSALSNQNSADHVSIRNLVSIVSVAAANATSIANAVSNKASALSVLISNTISNFRSADNVLSNQISVISVAAANALSVANAASNAASIISVALANELSVRAAADNNILSIISVLEARVSANSGTGGGPILVSGINAAGASVQGLQSVINALSNRIFILSVVGGGTGSVTSTELSAVSAQAASAINVLSAQLVSVNNLLSAQLTNVSARNISAVSVKGMQSVINALSNRISVVSSLGGGGGGGDVTTLTQTTTQTGPVNTTTETAIFSYTLPTDLAAGETLVLDITGEVLNSSGAGQPVDIYVKLGTTTAVFYSTTQGNSATKRNFHMRIIVYIVSTSSQKFSVVSQMAPGNTGTGGAITTSFAVGTFAGYGTAAEDTTSAKTLQVTADLGAANANFYWYAEAATLTRIAAP